MAKILVKRPLRFTPGDDYSQAIKLPVGEQELDDAHLDHEYIAQLISEGAIVLVGRKDSVEISIEEMTIGQLKDAIVGIKPDFDLKPLKVKADYVEALKGLKAESKEPPAE